MPGSGQLLLYCLAVPVAEEARKALCDDQKRGLFSMVAALVEGTEIVDEMLRGLPLYEPESTAMLNYTLEF